MSDGCSEVAARAPAAEGGVMPSPQVEWSPREQPVLDALRRVAGVMAQHYVKGRQHLLTEDVFRFATVASLEEGGVAPDRLAIEVPVPGPVRGKIDLVVDTEVAIEFKFPRDPVSDVGAADTMTFGEMLSDVYRLSTLPHSRRLAVWLLQDRLAGYLTRAAGRHAIDWPTRAGARLRLPAGLRGRLPSTAAALLRHHGEGAVEAEVVVYLPVCDGVVLVVLDVLEPPPGSWRSLAPHRPVRSPAPEADRVGRVSTSVRAEILQAIDALNIRSGSDLFTVQDVLAEMQRRGTRHATSTVTTMITSHMCIDGVSPTEWPDLRRVDRGLYRRVRQGEASHR